MHEIESWDALRSRLQPEDRYCYAFFHPSMEDEPLVFVEVALTGQVPRTIAEILEREADDKAPENPTCAVFYSISNCHRGLAGVSFGNFLIKQVVEELRREFDGLRTFVTLSPLPGLRRWATEEAEKEDGLLTAEQRALLDRLEGDQFALQGEDLPALAAAYLLEARSPRGGALDHVARFHLGNGARLQQINAAADLSARGSANAWGVMVNYLYDLKDIEKNHEAYANDGSIARSSSVQRLLKQSKRGGAHV